MNYCWIGHCKEDNSDKIWGIIRLSSNTHWNGDFVSFWGRRGKRLSTRIHKDASEYEMERLSDKKADKGYKQIDTARLEEVYPEFEHDLEATALWAMLKA
jgi:hypothetical protein